jgi:hypothetical protein
MAITGLDTGMRIVFAVVGLLGNCSSMEDRSHPRARNRA